MGNVFGKKKTVAEILKDAKRLVNRSIRELQREQRGMEREEKQLIADIKKHAKLQQMVRASLAIAQHIFASALPCLLLSLLCCPLTCVPDCDVRT